ncbi:MAG: hypothetical protein HZA89_18205, partial [Verrucomicrobia bacterium]|nr:hypothetical protein [Verrucomicrobiota bacterium]
MQKGSSRVMTPVVIGMYNDKYIEVKSGLKEGDLVMLSASSEGDSIDLSGSIADSEEADSAIKAAAQKAAENKLHPEEKLKKKLPPLVPKAPKGDKPTSKPPKPERGGNRPA